MPSLMLLSLTCCLPPCSMQQAAATPPSLRCLCWDPPNGSLDGGRNAVRAALHAAPWVQHVGADEAALRWLLAARKRNPALAKIRALAALVDSAWLHTN